MNNKIAAQKSKPVALDRPKLSADDAKTLYLGDRTNHSNNDDYQYASVKERAAAIDKAMNPSKGGLEIAEPITESNKDNQAEQEKTLNENNEIQNAANNLEADRDSPIAKAALVGTTTEGLKNASSTNLSQESAKQIEEELTAEVENIDTTQPGWRTRWYNTAVRIWNKFVTNVKSAANTAGDAFNTRATAAGKQISSAATTVGDAFNTRATAAGKQISSAATTAGDAFNTRATAAGKQISSAADYVGDAATAAGKQISSAATTVGSKASSRYNSLFGKKQTSSATDVENEDLPVAEAKVEVIPVATVVSVDEKNDVTSNNFTATN